jgi:predicted DNA-binding transcriptional regulator AlpA
VRRNEVIVIGVRTTEEAMTPEQRILRTPEAAQYLGLAKSTLEKLRLTGGGPKFIRLGIRALGYSPDDLQEWLRSRVRSSTSEPDTQRAAAKRPTPEHQAPPGEAAVASEGS